MKSKELAYKLYYMELGEVLTIDDSFGPYYNRVPGGWVMSITNGNHTSSVFIPYHDEFQEYVNSPTSISVRLRCPSCGRSILVLIMEKYQGITYKCSNCFKDFEYNHEEEVNV